jgi:hypothetical protein
MKVGTLSAWATMRSDTIKEIRRHVRSHLHTSGFDFKLVILKKELKLRWPFTAGLQDGIMGFIDRGVITDAHAGAITVVSYEQIAAEDLLAILKLAGRFTQRSFK